MVRYEMRRKDCAETNTATRPANQQKMRIALTGFLGFIRALGDCNPSSSCSVVQTLFCLCLSPKARSSLLRHFLAVLNQPFNPTGYIQFLSFTLGPDSFTQFVLLSEHGKAFKDRR